MKTDLSGTSFFFCTRQPMNVYIKALSLWWLICVSHKRLDWVAFAKLFLAMWIMGALALPNVEWNFICCTHRLLHYHCFQMGKHEILSKVITVFVENGSFATVIMRSYHRCKSFPIPTQAPTLLRFVCVLSPYVNFIQTNEAKHINNNKFVAFYILKSSSPNKRTYTHTIHRTDKTHTLRALWVSIHFYWMSHTNVFFFFVLFFDVIVFWFNFVPENQSENRLSVWLKFG